MYIKRKTKKKDRNDSFKKQKKRNQKLKKKNKNLEETK